jgi:hypothetical protein
MQRKLKKYLKKPRATVVSSGTVCTVDYWELKLNIWEEVC